ncbi:MAG TPA: chromosome segregation protein SMC [Fibrobacteria bacterium]|nr:chromosome segregation protein SMC [Fibrobacteria bacterium]
MYLSKLRIFGFKSFANKVEVNFPGEGITSVVGPNGCGKSNIIDAIRWVLGEQRAKVLRSGKMEDVIFSGTAERPPLNMAEVSLLINNDSGVLPSEYTQIMITRRAFRNGETEYLINNTPCRLKDIHNLFYDTGMGAASYSLIEAKMIDSILSDKAEERRVMFEEASGISKYKQQRKETLRQLERTALDLARVEDNLKFVQQNVNMFERQAKKAEKWREIKKAYVSLELSYNYDSYVELEGKFRAFEADSEKTRERSAALQSQITVRESELEEGKLLILEEEQALSRLNQVVAATNAEVVRLENELDRSKDRIVHLAESMRRLESESELAGKRMGEFAVEKRTDFEEIARLETERVALARLTEGHAEEKTRLHRNYGEKRRRADELAEERMQALEELSALRNRAASANTELQHLKEDEGELDAALQDVSERFLAFSEEKRGLEEDVRKLEAQVTDLGGRIGAGSARLVEIARELETLRAEDRAANSEKVALETRHAMLKGLQESMEGVDGGVKHLLAKAKERIQSLLADAIQVPDDAVVVAEKCLGRYLQALVVKDRGTELELLRELKASEKGEAFLFPAESAGENAFARARPDLSGEAGFQGWIIDKVKSEAGLRPLLELAMGNYALAESQDAAWSLGAKLAGRDIWLVTPAGEMVHASGLVLGGAKQGGQTGLLQRKNLMEQTAARLVEVAAKVKELSERIQALDAERKALEAGQSAMGQEQKQTERKWQEQKSKLNYLNTSLENMDKDKSQKRIKLETVREQLEERERGQADMAERLEEGEESRKVLENQFHQALEEVHKAEAERARFEEALRDLDKNKAQNESQAKALKLRVEYLDRSEKEQIELVGKNASQKAEWESMAAQLRERMEALADQIQALHDRMTGEEKLRDEAKGVYDSKIGRLDEMRVLIRNLNDELRAATQGHHDSSMKMEQARAAMKNIRERMFELHEVDLSSPTRLNDEGEPVLVFEKVAYEASTAGEEIASCKDKLKNLGNINPGALEDYEAEKAKLDEVNKQYTDLEKARLGLEKAIKKLDKVAREQFLATFGVVQKNFQEVFSSLFEGGEAQLALEDNVDPLDAKIEINARPTGKKMRGVSLLSGGERALTAISLLFALYLVRPSPYCIMDEVDGPLDDANIGRFVNLLRRFAHQTQFIVVTHNKRTMAASDMLYGVTQEIKGISKLVSVQLDEASRIAA